MLRNLHCSGLCFEFMDDQGWKLLGLPEEIIRKMEQEKVNCRSQVSSQVSSFQSAYNYFFI